MITAFTWITTALCLSGTVLNIKKNALCFWLWSAGNIAWLCFDVATGTYSRALLDVVQLGFAIWGIFAWRKK